MSEKRLHENYGRQPEKKRNGCLIAGIIVAVIAVIGVVGIIAAGIWGYGKVKDRISTDPAKVTQMANGIVEIDPGGEWTPQFAMDIFIMRMAAFTGVDGENSALVLMDGDPATLGTGEQFESRMRAEITKQHSQQGGNKREPTTQISSSRQDFLVGGQATSFLVVHSEGTDSKTKFIEVSGSFDSNQAGRTAFLYLRGTEDSLTLDDAKNLIESINSNSAR